MQNITEILKDLGSQQEDEVDLGSESEIKFELLRQLNSDSGKYDDSDARTIKNIQLSVVHGTPASG
jgi:hypothetical protein